MNPYEVLGLKPGASANEVKEAFRTRVAKWHPDKFRDPTEKANAERQFKEINAAYKAITSGKGGGFTGTASSGFEGFWQQGGGSSGFGDFGDINDVFEQMFGGGKARRSMIRRQKLTLEVDLYDTLQAHDKTLRWTKNVAKGTVAEELSVRLPQGVRDGDAFVAYRDSLNELVVKVKIEPKNEAARVGNDLYVVLRWENGKVSFTHPLAGKVEVACPARWGYKNVLKGYGFPTYGGVGDAIFIVSLGEKEGNELINHYLRLISKGSQSNFTFSWGDFEA